MPMNLIDSMALFKQFRQKICSAVTRLIPFISDPYNKIGLISVLNTVYSLLNNINIYCKLKCLWRR